MCLGRRSRQVPDSDGHCLAPLRRVAVVVLVAGIVLLSGAAHPASAFEVTRVVFSSGGGYVCGAVEQAGLVVGEAGIAGPRVVAAGGFTLGLGYWSWSPQEDVVSEVPAPPALAWDNALIAPRPNPFEAPTLIRYTIAKSGRVRLSIYDVTGSRVRTLVDAVQAAGEHQVEWDGRDVGGRPTPSGLYFYRLKAGSWSRTEKVMKLR